MIVEKYGKLFEENAARKRASEEAPDIDVVNMQSNQRQTQMSTN